MKLGVMSDSHGNLVYTQHACDLMIHKLGAQAIIHLGDDYADTKSLDTDGRPIYAVPGMYEAAWNDDRLSHRLIKEFGGVTFLISHTSTRDKHDRTGDINPGRALTRYGAQVLLHGHTHRFGVTQAVDGLIVVCPGHIKAEKDRGSIPTFAMIEAGYPDISISFVDLNGEVLEDESFQVVNVVREEISPTPPPSDDESTIT